MEHAMKAAADTTRLEREPEASNREYAEAIDLIHDIRDTGNSLRDGQVRHWSLPAGRVSADFFCSAEHPRQGWFCLLADTAGHGLPPAIFSLQTPPIFREAVRDGLALSGIYGRIHAALLRQQLARYFVCGLLVRIQRRDIEVLNAGMPEALLLARDGRLLDSFPSRHLPFGVKADATAQGQIHRLARGAEAALLLYSDGLAELGAPAGDAFGEEGVRVAAAFGVDRVADRLLDGIADHGHASHDDISIVLVQAPLKGEAQAMPTMSRLTPPAPAIDAALRVVEHHPHGMMLTDGVQRILYVNPAFSALTGYASTEAIGRTPRLIGPAGRASPLDERAWGALRESGRWHGELWARRKDGELRRVRADVSALRDAAAIVTHYLMSFADATPTQPEHDRLRHEALHDPITGLANRALLADRGEQALHRARRRRHGVAVLFIDLDRFKSINDSLGHDIGDRALAAVARRLAGVLSPSDTLARWIGDEFVCLLPEIDREENAGLAAGKLIDALQEPIEVAGHRFKIGASIGISAYPADAAQLDELIVLADRAMLLAKQAGGNLFRCYCAQLHLAVEQQLEMEARLDAAIRDGELELHYQPKIDLDAWRVEGAEALVRWRDPLRGLVPPGEFIPVAERSDLIAKIGHWVLDAACAALARWRELLPDDFHVAVNVSPLQLARADLVADVAAALAAHDVPPARLQLEITEALHIENFESAARALQGVADLGVSLALDDFGTGYSNLGALALLPIDTFKLDQSFVRGIDANRANHAIAKSVWHLADGLDKKVVVEGVETCGECMRVEALGYRTVQGYKFAVPMAEDEFLAYLADWPDDHCPFGTGDAQAPGTGPQPPWHACPRRRAGVAPPCQEIRIDPAEWPAPTLN
jgi:diguanylate cyclase (GGDEF)-like protein/PAS domain S-box-containing protein